MRLLWLLVVVVVVELHTIAIAHPTPICHVVVLLLLLIIPTPSIGMAPIATPSTSVTCERQVLRHQLLATCTVYPASAGNASRMNVRLIAGRRWWCAS